MPLMRLGPMRRELHVSSPSPLRTAQISTRSHTGLRAPGRGLECNRSVVHTDPGTAVKTDRLSRIWSQ